MILFQESKNLSLFTASGNRLAAPPAAGTGGIKKPLAGARPKKVE